MAVESNYIPPERGGNPGDVEPLLDEVQQLTWALLDEGISDDEFSRLEQVLLDECAARQTYLGCVQLHVDLQQYFAEEPVGTAIDSDRSPLLGFLDGMPSGFDVRPSQPNDSPQ